MNLMRNSDRKVKVDKKELLGKLEVNRVKHVEEYKEAVTEYKKAVIAKCTEIIEIAESNPLMAPVSLGLQAPTSYERVYRDYIALFDWDLATEVELDADEFQHLVLDNWDWKAGFESAKMSNSMYLSSSSRR